MQMLLDQMERKGIMPSCYRGVGGKHRGTLHLSHGLAKWHPSWHQWCVGPVEIFIHRLLAAIDREALVEVPLGIHEPNPDQRHPQVARFFAVVPSQNP